MSQLNCEFCEDEFSDTVLAEYDYWQVQLFLNQYYIGRSLIKLKRHAVDLTELKEEERKELFQTVLPDTQKAIDDLFNPDLYNQATLGNDCRHFHIHVIPRYEDDRVFDGKNFGDDNWNSHYKPYPKDFEVGEETFEKIRKQLGDKINS